MDGKTRIWVVFRRESRGPDKRGIYHYMGHAEATSDRTAYQMADAMCVDETYFTFSSVANEALPLNPIFPRDLHFPRKPQDPTEPSPIDPVDPD
jgi:hypothetical protein